MVDVVREVENERRPTIHVREAAPANTGKKPTRRWRRSIKPTEHASTHDNDIIGVHAYSPMIEEARQAMLTDQAEGRLEAFHKALGL
jgi:hypothetical protein